MDCAAHPGQPLVATCTRCGGFVCALDSTRVEANVYCRDCAAREVDWLAAFKQELWGKRDEFAWFYGVLGTFGNLGGALVIARAMTVGAFDVVGALFFVLALANGVVDIAYFLGARFTRVAVIAFPLVWLAAVLGTGQQPDAQVGGTIVSFLIGLSAFANTRNRLYFKIEVADEDLRKLWDKTRNNQAAQTGAGFAALGLLIPLFAVPGLVFSLVGLSKVDAKAVPPIGRRGLAITGLVLSLVSIIGWTGFIVYWKFHR